MLIVVDHRPRSIGLFSNLCCQLFFLRSRFLRPLNDTARIFIFLTLTANNHLFIVFHFDRLQGSFLGKSKDPWKLKTSRVSIVKIARIGKEDLELLLFINIITKLYFYTSNLYKFTLIWIYRRNKKNEKFQRSWRLLGTLWIWYRWIIEKTKSHEQKTEKHTAVSVACDKFDARSALFMQSSPN